MTERLDLADPHLLEFEASVVARREHEGRTAVVLDRTAFHPEGGGQPWDEGLLGDTRVVAVVERGGELLHVLDRPLAAERVKGRVDGERRRDHAQQHHGQHLLSRAFVLTARAETVAFHLGTAVTTIDLDRPVSAEQARVAEGLANEVVWQARPVRVSSLTVDEARAEGLAVPEDVAGAVRVVEVEGFDRQPCGGTHPRSSAEAGVIVVTALERYKGGTRVDFVCGRRALAAVSRRLQILDGLVSTLSAPLDDLVSSARKLQQDLLEGERRAKALLDRALEGDARRLLAEARGEGASPSLASPAVVVATFDGMEPAELRLLATKLVSLAPCVALLASRTEKAHLVFARSDGLGHDVAALLKDALALLGGRGGGRPSLAQGGGERLELLPEALSRAAATVRG